MMSDLPNNIIPINKALIQTLTDILKSLGNSWQGPSQYNAIMVDRKGFVQSFKVPNPPPPIWQVPIRPSIFKSFITFGEEVSSVPQIIEFAEFQMYRRCSEDTIEYREK